MSEEQQGLSPKELGIEPETDEGSGNIENQGGQMDQEGAASKTKPKRTFIERISRGISDVARNLKGKEQWVKDLENAREELTPLIGTELWIKRTSGAWQKAELTEVLLNGLCMVKWANLDKPGHFTRKIVRGTELVRWQKEAPNSDNAK